MPKANPYENAAELPEGEVISPGDLFEQEHGEIELEIGPGRGWFTVERLEAAPESRILGFEIRRKSSSIVDDRLRRLGFSARARCMAEDARLALLRLTEASIHRVYIHFPDPWWKKRHHKRILAQPEVIAGITRVLVPGGALFVQSDVEDRIDAYEEVASADPGLEAWETDGPRVAENPYGARSPRERRAIEDGLPIYRLRYRKRR